MILVDILNQCIQCSPLFPIVKEYICNLSHLMYLVHAYQVLELFERDLDKNHNILKSYKNNAKSLFFLVIKNLDL